MKAQLEELTVKTVAMYHSEHIIDPDWPETTICGKRISKKPRCKVCIAAAQKRRSGARTRDG